MRNNILGGLVIFVVVLTCLLMLDDISNVQDQPVKNDTVQIEHVESNTDLAVVEESE
ncbi:hypothetical protein [Winogradskyella aquimaris]|jgi:hypothetical protein|uniref:Uncharacterized protein n=1 Tax=Winogradskyella aquimaris TaxID=864074 RepID=A0ABU5EII8_9FLAO|nr:hypothetical protein [Winogradskyella aquimaris]MDY2585943.1 hypothetical protein [Winogradskyella aquimaris]